MHREVQILKMQKDKLSEELQKIAKEYDFKLQVREESKKMVNAALEVEVIRIQSRPVVVVCCFRAVIQ